MELEKIVEYYRKQGAPADQSALVSLLREVQRENGNAIPKGMLAVMAEALNVKESYLLAVIKRIPSLRVSDIHRLELCCGSNCGKRADLAAFVEKTYGVKPEKFELRYVPCMRMCGKGPNIRWDGKIYHGADETLIRKLIEE